MTEGDETKKTAQVMPMDWTQMGERVPPADRIRYIADVCDDMTGKEVICVGTHGQKITKMEPNLKEIVDPELNQLILRSHLIRKMEGISGLKHLTLLELYDNQIEYLEELADEDGAPGKTLTVLDMSYNVIREMQPVQLCPNLQELYLANNKLKTMAGLKHLSQLRKIDLGANRIREMDPEELSGLVNLEELWLGKNKIEEIKGLEKLTKLRRLDVQSNRLTSIDGLATQKDTLQELFLAHNGIGDEGVTTDTGLKLNFPNLEVLDLSRNRLTKTSAFTHLTSLDELWLSGNKINSLADVEPLSALGENLDTIYLEYNPVQEDPLYRKRIKEIIPSLTQIDANKIQGLSTFGLAPPAASLRVETEEERIKRLQDEVIARAKAETGKVGK